MNKMRLDVTVEHGLVVMRARAQGGPTTMTILAPMEDKEAVRMAWVSLRGAAEAVRDLVYSMEGTTACGDCGMEKEERDLVMCRRGHVFCDRCAGEHPIHSEATDEEVPF